MQSFKAVVFYLVMGTPKKRAVGYANKGKLMKCLKDRLLVIKVNRLRSIIEITLKFFLLIHSTKQSKSDLIRLSHLIKLMQRKTKTSLK